MALVVPFLAQMTAWVSWILWLAAPVTFACVTMADGMATSGVALANVSVLVSLHDSLMINAMLVALVDLMIMMEMVLGLMVLVLHLSSCTVHCPNADLF